MWPIAGYQFPVVTLAEGTSIEAICRMFEVVNRTGVKLGPFELLTARFRPQDINLREFREKAQADYPIIGEFAVDPYYILQIISLVTSTPPVSTRQSVLTLEASIVKGWWNRAVESLARSLEILRDDCGVFTPRLLPYNPLMLPLAAVLAKLTRPGSPTTGAIRQKLVRWFWCAVFGQTFDQGSNTQASRDVAELLEWCAGGDPPETIRGFQFAPRVLRDTMTRQSALYCGTMCLVMNRGPSDFHSGAKITGELMVERHIDAHHIFPQTYLQRRGVAARLGDSVLNCTLIDRTTNQSLFTRAPADYLAQIRTTLGGQPFRELLHSHLLPSEPDSPLWRNDFEEFLASRQEMLWQEIQRVTGLVHTPSRTQDDARLPLRIRGGGARPLMSSAQEDVVDLVAHPRTLPGLEDYLARQSHQTRHLWETLDSGICALAPDIQAQTTKGRRRAGGVSYATPERRFFCADFIEAGEWLSLSVYTDGQRWEGLNLALSEPWGYAVVRTKADLPQALAWAKAAYEARKRAL